MAHAKRIDKKESESHFESPSRIVPRQALSALAGLQRAVSPQDLMSEICDQKACFNNWRIPNAEEHFPYQPLMRTVEYYFPFTKDRKALWCDVAKNKPEENAFEEKRKIMRKLGLRYVVLTESIDMISVMEQIGYVDHGAH